MNVDIEESQNFPTYLDFQATQPKGKTMSNEISGRPWGSVGAYIVTINNKHYLCIVDYQSKFQS